jgi:hypothetical protein
LSILLKFVLVFKNARPETVTNDDEEALDEETKRRDQMIKGAIEVLIREYSSELNAPSQESDSHPRKKKKEKKEDVCVLTIVIYIIYSSGKYNVSLETQELSVS